MREPADLIKKNPLIRTLHSKPSIPQRMALLMLAASLTLLAVGFGWWTRQDFAETERNARKELEAATLLLEQQVLRSVTAIDNTLIDAAALVNEIGIAGLRSEATWTRLRALTHFLPESGALFIYDLKGDTLIASSSFPAPAFNAADRNYFRHLLAGGAEPYIGQALQGRTVHNFFFPVARAIRSPGGDLLAVAQVGVSVDYMGDYFRYVGLGANKSFGLYRNSDGALVAHYPMSRQLLGETIATQPYFSRLTLDGGHWTGPLGGVNGELLISARRLRELPLVITASMTFDDIYERAHGSLLRRGAVFVIAAGLLGLLGFLWLRAVKQEIRVGQELRASEEMARQRQEEIEELYRHAPVGLCMMDTELRWLRINDLLAEMNGFPADRHIGQRVRDLLPQLADLVEPEMRKVIETGEAILDREITGDVTQSGSPRIWLASWLPMKGHDGAILGINVVAQDITERKRMEAALQAQAEQLQAQTEQLQAQTEQLQAQTEELQVQTEELQIQAEELHVQTEELQSRNEELDRFNQAMIGRELDMIRLKQQVNDLSVRLGQAKPYSLDFLNSPDFSTPGELRS